MNLKQMIFAATIAAALPMQANAATATANLNVSVNVIAPTGSISASGPVDFGTVLNTDNINIDRTINLTVNVTQGIPYTITMNGG